MNRLMTNDPLFIVLFVVGFGVGVSLVLFRSLELLRLVLRRRRRIVHPVVQVPAEVIPSLTTFDRLDAVVDELARKVS